MIFAIVPPILRESAYGLGFPREVVHRVVLPYTQKGVVGESCWAFGRAPGETMAVTFVIGNANRMPTSLFSPGTSIASTLANEFGEAADFHLSTLFALGFCCLSSPSWCFRRPRYSCFKRKKAKGL